MIKKVFLFVAIGTLLGLSWYLFGKPYDYKATFKTKATAGTFKETLKLWAKQWDSSVVIPQNQLHRFTHTMAFHDSLFAYDWTIGPSMDSLSQVVIHITDKDHSLMHRIRMPFTDTDFEKRSKKTVLDFYDHLEEHLDNISVSIIGLDSLPPTYCAYIPLESRQHLKASNMMKSYPILDGFVSGRQLFQNTGRPFIEVVHWNYPQDSITYNFCYPIRKSDSLPIHPKIKYKQFMGVKGVKAIYHGNYITSDRAWYHLLEYAQTHGISVAPKPVEIFHDNPNFSSNAIEWVTEVFMPLSE